MLAKALSNLMAKLVTLSVFPSFKLKSFFIITSRGATAPYFSSITLKIAVTDVAAPHASNKFGRWSSQRSSDPVPHSSITVSSLGLSDFMDPLGKGGLILIRWDASTESLYSQGLSTRIHSQSVNVFHHPHNPGILIVRNGFSFCLLFMSSCSLYLLRGSLPTNQVYLLTQPILERTHPSHNPFYISSPAGFHYGFCITQHHYFRRHLWVLTYHLTLHGNHPLYYILSKQGGS